MGRYLALIRGARLRWLPGSNHVPISDDPDLVAHAFGRTQGGPMTTVKTVATVTGAVAVTAAAVIGIGVLIGLSTWELL